ncbi:MAG: hypothetical protein HXS48_27595 [Theionarchaea archaeon]|nr:MAG: hypothetical protein AYK19_01970 [Theionarchaea archaeon DG-70-1]MBU7030727.1 hypothetical protein [Theionarchaea archaeon]
MILSGTHVEYEAVMEAGRLVLASIRTAPKARGLDTIYSCILTGNEKQKIADWLKGQERAPFFERDGKCVEKAQALILVGVKGEPVNLNCGGCGFETCDNFKKVEKKNGDYTGPNCIFKLIDLGIALGSAVKTAGLLNVDNRIFYTAGTAAKALGFLNEADVIMGVPLALAGKNPFFDR